MEFCYERYDWFEEPGFKDDAEDDPYGVSSPENIMAHLNARAVEEERGK